MKICVFASDQGGLSVENAILGDDPQTRNITLKGDKVSLKFNVAADGKCYVTGGKTGGARLRNFKGAGSLMDIAEGQRVEFKDALTGAPDGALAPGQVGNTTSSSSSSGGLISIIVSVVVLAVLAAIGTAVYFILKRRATGTGYTRL